MSSPAIIAVLRLIHIVVGVFWVGGVIFMTSFLAPAVKAVGPAAGPVMQHLMQRQRVSTRLLGAAIVTILAGVLLYGIDSGWGSATDWMRSVPARVFGLGALFAIAGVVVGAGFTRPAANKMGQLAGAIQSKGGPPSPADQAELQRLQGVLATTGRWTVILLVLATACMAVARYT
jgi:uncharacterized membrane protein